MDNTHCFSMCSCCVRDNYGSPTKIVRTSFTTVYHFTYVNIWLMVYHKLHKKLLLPVLLVVAFGLVLFSVYLLKKQDSSTIKTDSYFYNKYNDLKDHDACLDEFRKSGQTDNRLIGIPCPGEPQ